MSPPSAFSCDQRGAALPTSSWQPPGTGFVSCPGPQKPIKLLIHFQNITRHLIQFGIAQFGKWRQILLALKSQTEFLSTLTGSGCRFIWDNLCKGDFLLRRCLRAQQLMFPYERGLLSMVGMLASQPGSPYCAGKICMLLQLVKRRKEKCWEVLFLWDY